MSGFKVLHETDISLENLLSRLDKAEISYDKDLIIKAYTVTKEAHNGQLRRSGEEYFVHPINVAFILIELNMDQEAIIAGMMHDVLEDTDVTKESLTEEFGEEIVYLVEGVTKLTKMPFKSKLESQAGNLRKMIMAMSNDIRVIIIKLADRLHNMRTLEYMTKSKQFEKATETLEIYAPLAHRLGINKIKWELEDLSFLYLNPREYHDISKKVNMRREEREIYLGKVMEQIREEMIDLEIQVLDISGRPKHLYSIYNKMKKQDKTFEEIYDLLGMRIIVSSIKECYAVLGIVHQLWKPIPGKFKDYIAMPKANMYQSIHSTVVGPGGKVFEVQIRTEEMHRTAEYGIAAHWQYKEGGGKTDKFEQKLTWLRMLMEWQQDLKDPKEFMDTLKDDFFSDEVYVFSPKGDVIGLPAGSIPIDFAYRVHSAVGNHCVGAKVNGKLVPIDTKLKNGDVVEIITSSNSSGPSKDWVDMVQSSSARQKIKQFFKKSNRDENIIKGKDMLEKEVHKQGFEFCKILKEEWLLEIAEKLSFKTLDDLYSAIGYGTIALTQVIPKLKVKYKDYYQPELSIEEINEQAKNRAKPTSVNGIIVEGIDNIKVTIAKCCNPVPGDDILGYITKGRGVSVHRTDCPNMAGIDFDRTMDVRWDNASDANYNLHLNLVAYDRVNYIANISETIGNLDINIENISANKKENNMFVVDLILSVNGKLDVTDVINKMKQVEGTIEARRVR